MLEIFIFVNLDHDSATSSKKCQYFLYRKFRVRGDCRGAGVHSSILTGCNLFNVSVPFNHTFKCIILTFEENAFGEFGGLSSRSSDFAGKAS